MILFYLFVCLLLQVNTILLRKVIHLGDVDPIVAGFAIMGFHKCGGVTDGTHTHIPINRKGNISMVLQALVDHYSQFLDIFVG